MIRTSDPAYIAHQLNLLRAAQLASAKTATPPTTAQSATAKTPVVEEVAKPKKVTAKKITTYTAYLKHLLETDKPKALSYFKKADITAMNKNDTVLQSKVGSKARLTKEYNFLKAIATADSAIANKLRADLNGTTV